MQRSCRLYVENLTVEHAARGKNELMIRGKQRTRQYRFDWSSGPRSAGIQRSGQTGECATSSRRLRSKLIECSLSENGRAEIQRRQEFRIQMRAGGQELRMVRRQTPEHSLQPFFWFFHC